MNLEYQDFIKSFKLTYTDLDWPALKWPKNFKITFEDKFGEVIDCIVFECDSMDNLKDVIKNYHAEIKGIL